MSEFLNPDNKFFQSFGKIVDVFCLSLLWFLLCLPVVTAGASTTALYYTVNKVIRNNRGYLWKEYWHAFGSDFKQSTVVWLIVLALYALLGIDGYIMYQFAVAGASYGILYIFFLVLMAFVTMWAQYLFPYIARFEATTKSVLKNGVLLAIGNLGWTLLLFALLAVVVGLTVLFLPAVFFLPAVYMLLANLILERIFAKYMKPEDLEAERERNREYFN